MTVPTSPAKLLAEAKNAAGDRAVEAHREGDFSKAREWQSLAAECDRLLRDAVAMMSA